MHLYSDVCGLPVKPFACMIAFGAGLVSPVSPVVKKLMMGAPFLNFVLSLRHADHDASI